MLQQLDEFGAGEVEADVCVVGAGPAGITLALELAGRGRTVALLEGGGLTPPQPRELDLYRGEVSGRKYPLQGSRLRYFGGSSGHWGGWSRPLDPIDFAHRPQVPYSGWPITRADLDPWYRRAHEWLQMPSDNYYEAGLPGFSERLLPQAHGLVTGYFRFSPPTRFGDEYREAVRDSEAVSCLLGANATALEWRGGRVTAVRARSLAGTELQVRAQHTVLAMGGIENARFLLNATEQPEAAPGNQGGWLGRGFMDHSGWSPGDLVSRSDLAYHRFVHDEVQVMPFLRPDPKLLMEQDLANCMAMLLPRKFDEGVEPEYFRNAWLGGGAGLGEVANFRLQMVFEPSPCRDSRIVLAQERDETGLRRVRLNWALNAEDFERLDRSITHFIRFIGITGTGRLKRTKPVNSKTIAGRLGVGYHHAGTTRMSADPDDGVVDAQCRVHGSDNLYVAGNSVFPSVGFSNPTLTIVALACRLAAQLAPGEAA